MPLIRAEGIRKEYGKVTALNGVNLTIKDGEYLSIVGPSGCGKTTLIKSIAGVVKPDAGDILIDGNVVTSIPIEDRGVGYVFQEIALFPHMNVYDNVSYGLMVRGVSPLDRSGPVEEMLHMMNLEAYVSLYPKELSGGARQKTAISRALTSGSTLLLLDEPLGALDLKVRTILRYELRRLVKDLGLTAIHVTHDQEEALSVSDRIVVMRAGQIVEAGPSMQLYLRPEKIFTAKFLGEANFMTAEVTETRNGDIIVNVDGSRLITHTNINVSLEEGEKCVLAIRPEFVDLSTKPGGVNTWACEIISASFVGDTMRYDVRAENSAKLLVKAPITGHESSFMAGDKVFMTLPDENLLVYRWPEEGLEKALSLE